MPAGDRIEQMVREIAVRHGVAVGRDDPILMLLTINERLVQDGEIAQRALLDQFKSELEGMTRRVGDEAKTQAASALQATLQAGQAALTLAVQENSAAVAEVVRAEVQNSARAVRAQLRDARRVSLMSMGASLLVLLAAFVVAWGGR